MDAAFSYEMKPFMLSVSFENILNTEWKQEQFETESRLQHEAMPVKEIHFTPGTPRNIKVSLQFDF
jgi:hypothetical protein